MSGPTLVVVGIAFRELTHKTLRVLEDVRLPAAQRGRGDLERESGYRLAEFAYVDKCNAVLLVITVDGTEGLGTADWERLKDAWCKLAGPQATKHREEMRTAQSLEAYHYLLETAVGLHSVVLGDSQVYSQLRAPLVKGANTDPKSTFHLLLRLMRQAEGEIKANTRLHRGYTSLERLACQVIAERLESGQDVAVVGLGSSGKLVTKILREEQHRNVFVAARSQSSVEAVVAKYGSQPVRLRPQNFLGRVAGLIVTLDNNEETRQYARYFRDEIEQCATRPLVIDLASPPLTDWEHEKYQILDITDLSDMAQQVVNERQGYVTTAKTIVERIITHALHSRTP